MMRKHNEALMCELTQKLKNVCLNKTYKNLLYQQNLIDLTYHSTRLEGNCLDRNETEALIHYNIRPLTKDMKWSELTRNHHAALLQIVQDAYNHSHHLIPFYLRQMHGILSKYNKSINHTITDTTDLLGHWENLFYSEADDNFYCPFGQADEVLSHFLKQVKLMTSHIKKSSNPIPLIVELAIFCHNSIIMIEPYHTSNGMLARLIMNYILLKYDLPFLVVNSEEYSEYNSFFRKRSFSKKSVSSINFMEYQYLESLKTIEVTVF
ncbi:hypothetical protein SanaruYs_34660 [Chryseotalea sanaruensis]|uniref:Fido domain-containing protein n=1 Tax=Chryseotalea sanaruensis TaxID=2482724 RepID=A0A401UEA8_9BACT|nr:hypothetical protein [Chryseotalea sanaruensis]GCC53223.1 hypothetical protein SanaruYs_34660 [Chryseotalea sanaruensis]